MAPFNAAKTKVQLKLAAHRCQLLQEKQNALAKKDRREIASLVERGKIETARVKTEGLIGQDIALELLEIIELYTEMLIARFGLLEMNTSDPDPAIKEPLCAIIHAAPRIELREMHMLRDMLMQKYGREYALAAMENTDGCVSERITSRLRVETPSRELVDMYITEICKAYNVPFESEYANKRLIEGDPPEAMTKPHAAAEGPLPAINLSSETSASTKGDAAIATSIGTVEPSSTAKPSRKADDSKASSTVSKQGETPSEKSVKSADAGAAPAHPKKNNDDQRFEDLEARFAALKRK